MSDFVPSPVTVWDLDLTGLDKNTFYAASYFIHEAGKQRGKLPEPIECIKVEEQSKDVNDFLDRLALLLARFKNKSAKTPGNVTATGLVTTQADSTLGRVAGNEIYKVYIAKNIGLEDREDQELIEILQRWFNGESSELDLQLSQSNAVWRTILETWSDRIRFYAKKLRSEPLKVIEEAKTCLRPILQAFGRKKIQLSIDDDGVSIADNDQAQLYWNTDHHLILVLVFLRIQIESGNKEVKAMLEDLEIEGQQFSKNLEQWLNDNSSSSELDVQQKLESLKCDSFGRILITSAQIWGSHQQIRDIQISGFFYSRISVDKLACYLSDVLKLATKLSQSSHFATHQVENWLEEPAFDLFGECYEIRTHPLKFPPLSWGAFWDDAKLGKRLGKIVHWLEMLGTLRSMWSSFHRFRQRCRKLGFPVEFIALKCPKPQTMKKEDLINTMKSWKGVEAFQEFVSKTILPNLKSDFMRYAHCELQILQLMLFDPQVRGAKHRYIGCSKGSCEMCWQILCAHSAHLGGVIEGFRTGKSHHRVSANCEFPFRPSQMAFLPDALRSMQKEWTDVIFLTRDGKKTIGQLSRYTERLDTNPDASVPMEQWISESEHGDDLESPMTGALPSSNEKPPAQLRVVRKSPDGELHEQSVNMCILNHQAGWSKFQVLRNQDVHRGNRLPAYTMPDLPWVDGSDREAEGSTSPRLTPWLVQTSSSRQLESHFSQDPQPQSVLWFYRIRNYEDSTSWDPTPQGHSYFCLWQSSGYNLREEDFKYVRKDREEATKSALSPWEAVRVNTNRPQFVPHQWENLRIDDTRWNLAKYSRTCGKEDKTSALYRLEKLKM